MKFPQACILEFAVFRSKEAARYVHDPVQELSVGAFMRVSAVIFGTMLIAQLTIPLAALTLDETMPNVTDRPAPPAGDVPKANEPSMPNYGDRNELCLTWTDGCVTCRRSETGDPVCSNIGISCQPKDIRCVR
jgi:hypothetical protein